MTGSTSCVEWRYRHDRSIMKSGIKLNFVISSAVSRCRQPCVTRIYTVSDLCAALPPMGHPVTPALCAVSQLVSQSVTPAVVALANSVTDVVTVGVTVGLRAMVRGRP